jgi:hypothetical protein
MTRTVLTRALIILALAMIVATVIAGCGEAVSDRAVNGACHPSYEGACLDPNSYDYDCEGGMGDGPDYTGEVDVVGDDPFDLDRDHDGTACEPYYG